ncbi:kinase-like protein [Violaceomyces palustris]|uniref:Kinase-like protein n=1 Tax=Violaceomyces palustris TaxID=1673888 RepID=A0ACD0NZT6_9BASI|nr:kinase-like protein [Violaceomyces palustris]
MDLISTANPSELQVVLRTRDHAALYDPNSNSVSMQSRHPSSSNLTSALTRRYSPASSTDPHQTSSPSKHGQGAASSSASSSAAAATTSPDLCPTCLRPWPTAALHQLYHDPYTFIAPNYFRLLAQATSVTNSNQNSRPTTPATPVIRSFPESSQATRDNSRTATPELSFPLDPSRNQSPSGDTSDASERLSEGTEAQGYYGRFFVEIKKLGRGARGTVFLCQHVLNGNKLGKYAIKKIPVGDHSSSLLKSLNEVHLMESLHHPNLIHYQHAWIESCQMSKFSPRVPTLHVLMMAANGGSLADWVSARSGERGENESPRPSNESNEDICNLSKGPSEKPGMTSVPRPVPINSREGGKDPGRSKIERLKAAMRQRRASRNATGGVGVPFGPPPSTGFGPASMGVGVHLLREDEIFSLLQDMASGLNFLHDRGILHLDIKPANVLLNWDEDSLIPRAMLSDFGSSLLLEDSWKRQRSGHTGTMEYMSPETLRRSPITGEFEELSSKADIWSLGMILHLLLFFSLPYSQVDDVDILREEMLAYRGFKSSDLVMRGAGLRKPRSPILLRLLEGMLDLEPSRRPSCAEILSIISSSYSSTSPKATYPGGSTTKLAREASPPEKSRTGLSLMRRSSYFPGSDSFVRENHVPEELTFDLGAASALDAEGDGAVISENGLRRRKRETRRLSIQNHPYQPGRFGDGGGEVSFSNDYDGLGRGGWRGGGRKRATRFLLADLLKGLVGLDLDPQLLRSFSGASVALFKVYSLQVRLGDHLPGTCFYVLLLFTILVDTAFLPTRRGPTLMASLILLVAHCVLLVWLPPAWLATTSSKHLSAPSLSSILGGCDEEGSDSSSFYPSSNEPYQVVFT